MLRLGGTTQQILEVCNFARLPDDLLKLVVSYLGAKALANLNRTCKKFYSICSDNLQQVFKMIHIEQYGAIASSEAGIPILRLLIRIKAILALKLPQPTSSLLSFDQDNNPKLSSYSEIIPKNTSIWRQSKAKYHFYRGEHHKVIAEKVVEIVQQQANISKEIFNQPLNTDHPPQALRDCARRLQVIEEERKCLNKALESSRVAYAEAFSLLEKVVFKIISYVHSFFELPFDPLKEIHFPQINSTFEFFINKKFVEFRETVISHKGEEIPVKIIAFFPGVENFFYEATVFKIQRKGSDEVLGSIRLKRNRKERFLQVDYVRDFLLQDPLTGNFPIKCLLTQIAVEVFQHEAEVELEMTANHQDGDVFCAAGFFCSNDEKQNFILKRIKEAREQKQFFPLYEDLRSFTCYLSKSKVSSQTTQFVYRDNNNNEHPALVDFTFEAPITWEEQIAKQPLLGISRDLYFPSFTNNLFKLEDET